MVARAYETDRYGSVSVAKESYCADEYIVALVRLVSSDRDKLRHRPVPAGWRRADERLVRQLHTRVVRHSRKWTWRVASLKVVASHVCRRHGAVALPSHQAFGELTGQVSRCTRYAETGRRLTHHLDPIPATAPRDLGNQETTHQAGDARKVCLIRLMTSAPRRHVPKTCESASSPASRGSPGVEPHSPTAPPRGPRLESRLSTPGRAPERCRIRRDSATRIHILGRPCRSSGPRPVHGRGAPRWQREGALEVLDVGTDHAITCVEDESRTVRDEPEIERVVLNQHQHEIGRKYLVLRQLCPGYSFTHLCI